MRISISRATTDFVRIEINNQPLPNGNLLDLDISYTAGCNYITICNNSGHVFKVTAIDLERILKENIK